MQLRYVENIDDGYGELLSAVNYPQGTTLTVKTNLVDEALREVLSLPTKPIQLPTFSLTSSYPYTTTLIYETLEEEY